MSAPALEQRFVEQENLERIVASVVETMIGLNVVPVATPWSPEGERVTATVHVAGSWSGAVVLETTREQACRFTARFLSVETPPAVNDDVRDVLGELANMIGGNLKTALAPGAALTMPIVVDGGAYHVRVCAGTTSQSLAFESEEGTFWVLRFPRPLDQSGFERL
jgi:CheY-specific phosphatase CheX